MLVGESDCHVQHCQERCEKEQHTCCLILSTEGLICLVSYLLGLVFVSRAGIYFLDLPQPQPGRDYAEGSEKLSAGLIDSVGDFITALNPQYLQHLKIRCYLVASSQ